MDSLHGGVVRLFRIYMSELEATIRFARTGEPPAGMEMPPPTETGRLPLIARRLTEVLTRLQHEAAQRAASLGADEFEECRYAMVALADDLLLSADWPGRRAWLHEPLELRLFGTQKAGQEVFDRIQRLLSKDVGDDRELAVVYLLILSMGFRGSQRDARGEARIARLKELLFNYFFHRNPNVEHLKRRRLAPDAYRNVLAESAARHLPYLRPWVGAGIALLIGYLGLTQLVWYSKAAPINDLVGNLQRLVGS